MYPLVAKMTFLAFISPRGVDRVQRPLGSGDAEMLVTGVLVWRLMPLLMAMERRCIMSL